MRKILIIGIGAGNPDHLTMEAVGALNRLQAVFIPDKGAEKEELRRVRRAICDRFITRPVRLVEFEAPRRRTDLDGYPETVAEWHGRIADRYARLLRDDLGEGETGGFLVWGDPALYDSTLRVLATVRARGEVAFDDEVVPGITSVQVLAARHRVALNSVGGAVHVTTGRRLAAEGFPDGQDSVVVMLDGDQAFARLDRDDLDIFWGASLGLADEILLSGPLAEVADEIARARADARRAKGWIMDTYLLRKRGT